MHGQKVLPFRRQPRWLKRSPRRSYAWLWQIWTVPLVLSLSVLAYMAFTYIERSGPDFAQSGWGTVDHVYDGDTLTVFIPDADGSSRKRRVRLLDIDTAELDGARCSAERNLAVQQRDHLASLVGNSVQLDITGTDRYGRLLAQVYNDAGENVSERMIAEADARPYNGGRRSGWC